MYRTHACLLGKTTYLQAYPCAACWLASFEQAGAAFAKLGGRGRSLDERLRALAFLKQAQALASDADRRQLYERTFGVACQCYYGEATQSNQAIEPRDDEKAFVNRRFVGSQTNYQQFLHGLEDLASGVPDDALPLTIMVPPLSEAQLTALPEQLAQVALICAPGTHVCVNDLGTLVQLAKTQVSDAPFTLTMGSLLARTDDPAEVASFLDPQANPSRLVFDQSGQPRQLVYEAPTEQLRTHWEHPSNLEPTALAAIEALTGVRPAYEFAE